MKLRKRHEYHPRTSQAPRLEVAAAAVSSEKMSSHSSGPDNVEKAKDRRNMARDSTTLTSEDNEVQPSTELSPESEYITGLRLYAVLTGLTLVMLLIMLDQTIVVTAIPRITNRFNSIKDIGWYGSAYLLSLAALQPLQGKIYTYYTSKKIFLTTLFIFEVGSLICALANSSAMLIIGRAITGIGSSGLLIGSLTILSAAAPNDKRPLYIGIMLGIASLGLVLGPVLGGLFTQHATWRWCFWLNLPIGGITGTILGLMRIPDSKLIAPKKGTPKEQVKRLDLPGFAFFTPTCIMLLLALEWGGVTYSWNSATIIGLFCGAGGACIIFLFWESRQGETAMIPIRLLKNRVVVTACLTTAFSQGSLILVTYYLPVWFQVVLGASPTMGGVDYLPSVGAQIVVSIATGALTTRTGLPTPFAILGCALTSISCGLLSTLTTHSPTAHWIGYQILLGASRGLTMQQPIAAISAVIPQSQLAVGNSLIMFTNVLGGAMFVSFGQTVFSNQLKGALKHFAPDVDAEAVLRVGATAFRSVVGPGQVGEVVRAYNRALTRVLYLGAGASVASFVAAWGMGWTNLKTKKVDEKDGKV
ncbi:related to MFS multidrug transporter [Phialocephala subalpina]|uniref:Related to MFS multidrug transporter n=1 Tax=Phialocephala subalpina TaxID=576137 RepID=A0A1L7WFN6_9HELO|nr:related to MFS multidrug transporter [Phialocephala subalpina]